VFPKATHGIDSKNHLDYVAIEEVIESLAPPSPKYYFSERAVQGVKNAKPNMKRALAQDIKKPCLTITSHLAKVSLNSRDPVLLVDQQRELYRRFTPLEAARIQSFPDSFIFCGSEGDAYRQIGNAIPPVLFWHVTRSVIKQLFNNRK
jgi:DNA (cytosine-5)-methyltransferase 1